MKLSELIGCEGRKVAVNDKIFKIKRTTSSTSNRGIICNPIENGAVDETKEYAFVQHNGEGLCSKDAVNTLKNCTLVK